MEGMFKNSVQTHQSTRWFLHRSTKKRSSAVYLLLYHRGSLCPSIHRATIQAEDRCHKGCFFLPFIAFFFIFLENYIAIHQIISNKYKLLCYWRPRDVVTNRRVTSMEVWEWHVRWHPIVERPVTGSNEEVIYLQRYKYSRCKSWANISSYQRGLQSV